VSAVPLTDRRTSDYARLSRLVKDAGLLERRRAYYIWRIVLNAALASVAGLALVLARDTWWELLVAGYFAVVSTQFAFGSYMAQVAEVSVGADGDVRVHRVVCAVDCGQNVNPDTIVAQMEGGIVFGASAALWDQITVEKGRVQQSNFSDYRVMRMPESPAIEVYIVNSRDEPGGIGEPGTAGIAPALANAVFAATGKRIRKLPIGEQLKKT